MSESTPLERIYRAQRTVRHACQTWDATNLDRANQCRELLEQAVADLREAVNMAAAAGTCLPVEARRILTTLQQDSQGMTRLVDACSAFQRGLALRLGHADPNYDASGLAQAMHGQPAQRVALNG